MRQRQSNLSLLVALLVLLLEGEVVQVVVVVVDAYHLPKGQRHRQQQPTTNSLIQQSSQRRRLLLDAVTAAALVGSTGVFPGTTAWADDDAVVAASLALEQQQQVLTNVSGDAKKLFNEGRAYESQGNMAAAQRVYNKVTLIQPRFVYAWSNLGNTQTALGDLNAAEGSYTKAIDLCAIAANDAAAGAAGGKSNKCPDLYVLLLNRGSLRLNNGRVTEALQDLTRSNALRGRPDGLVLQNLARAKELNGLYQEANVDYTMAIGLSANEVNPFWLRAALVKYQLGDWRGAYDLFQRVENRFPEAPEVRAAAAVLLATVKQDEIAARRKFLEIPNRQRLAYANAAYVQETIAWPPAMREALAKITTAVGDSKQ